MKLREFLEFFDFDYRYDGDEIALIDVSGANLGDIESERFSKDNLLSIIDRLDVYYKDYIFNDLAEKYDIDPDDWQAIYTKAKEDKHPYIDVLNIIMGDEKLTLHTIIHDIEWDTDGEEVDLPEYMVIPDQIDEEVISDYISNQTGYCHKGYKVGMIFIDCLNLLQKCIDDGILEFNPEIANGSILVYHTAGEETIEGWYWQNIMDAAAEMFHNEMSQIELINEINKNN